MKNILLLTLAILISLGIVSCEKEENEPERIYTKTIERNFSTVFEKNLIEMAEAWYPPREEVLAVADTHIEIPDTLLWFYNWFDGVYIPYAITAEAVDYYSDLIDQFNRDRKNNFFYSAELNYSAIITFHQTYQSPEINSLREQVASQNFESVYVVKMNLEWNQYCGSLCAMWIKKERIAVFNENGELIEVFLDGPISVLVS